MLFAYKLNEAQRICEDQSWLPGKVQWRIGLKLPNEIETHRLPMGTQLPNSRVRQHMDSP
jgi:hypothetical protein